MKPANFPGRLYRRRLSALKRLSSVREGEPEDRTVQRDHLILSTEGDLRYYSGIRTKKDRTASARLR
jgi:hypothetical protein